MSEVKTDSITLLNFTFINFFKIQIQTKYNGVAIIVTKKIISRPIPNIYGECKSIIILTFVTYLLIFLIVCIDKVYET